MSQLINYDIVVFHNGVAIHQNQENDKHSANDLLDSIHAFTDYHHPEYVVHVYANYTTGQRRVSSRVCGDKKLL
jgi:hypothetical protein